LRYSYTLAGATVLGALLNRDKLSWGGQFLVAQEKLILAFLGLVWLLALLSEPTQAYTVVDHPSVKLTKVVIFVMLLTHVVTTIKTLDAVLWIVVVSAFVLGLEAYETPLSAFYSGRLENVGGPDFHEANALAAYLAAVLPLVGIQFLRSRWPGKLLCLAAGAFILNAVVLARSRGAVIGLAAGAVVGILLCPRSHRLRITVCVVLGVAALFYLGDAGFWMRTGTIAAENRDRSAESRLEIWQGGFRMACENPQGVGPGNFQQSIGSYAPMHADRDAHSTLVRTLAELGFLGLAILAALVANAVLILLRSGRQIENLVAEGCKESQYLAFGLLVSLTVFLTSGLMGSFTYVEALWWILALPVCLTRALYNARVSLDRQRAAADAEHTAVFVAPPEWAPR
jgi:putative inorganic carbon (hco3(-)) transporter